MSVALLAPLGLAALAALVLPILIHIARRIELQTTDFAALRWISERMRPRRRIHIERPWLLLLRLLLLALIALLLARPVWVREAEQASAYVAVAPGVDRAAARGATVPTNAEWHWLVAGFPSLDAGSPAGAGARLASLLRELDARLPASTPLTVVVPRELDGLDGERVELARAIDWRILDGAMRVDGSAASDDGERVLVVRYVNKDDAALPYLRAAVAAWNTRATGRYRLDFATSNIAIPASARWLVWLDGALAPAAQAWVEQGGTAITAGNGQARGVPVWRSRDGAVLARESGRGSGRVITLDTAMTPAALPILLDGNFPARLLDAFVGEPPAPSRATANAARPLHDAALASDAPRDPTQARSADGWLAALIALLFAAERLVATQRPADAAP